MDFNTYSALFKEILDGNNTTAPYDDAHFVEYVKLNASRQNRWIKTGVLSQELTNTIEKIKDEQHWVLITEPWCGDASHSVPFIAKMAELNPNIKLEIQLRDSDNSEINNYLTNSGKAIPILVVRNSKNEDLFVWGPRPAPCQQIFLEMKKKDLTLEEQKVVLQNWYNNDKGVSIQVELNEQISKYL
jgi:hypothetical protein